MSRSRRISTLRSRLLWLLVILAVGLVAGLMPTGLYVLRPGTAEDLSRMVSLPGGQVGGGGRYLMVTVRADPATTLTAVAAAFTPSWDVVPRSGLIPEGQTVREYLDQAARDMTLSQQTAVEVAGAYIGRRLTGVTFDVGEVAGPSAGVMLALEIIRQVRGKPPAQGLTVAGSGMLLPDGSLARVGGLRQKVAAAEAGGADYFLVPRAEADEARAAAHRITVIAADSLAEAVEALQGLGPGPR